MTERFLEDARMCVERYVRVIEKEASDRDERLLKEIHRLCCLIADKENGTGIAPLSAIARKLADLHEEAKGRNEIAAALYDFGSGFALLRASAFQETVAQFEKFPEYQGDGLRAIELAASCFGCVAASLGSELKRARVSLTRAKRLAETIAGDSGCYQCLVVMAESSILYKFGEHEATIKLVENHRKAFFSANAPLNSTFPYFHAQALLTEAKALRDMGRYTDGLDLLYHERKLRALINDLLGQVWSLLEEARIRKFRREFESAEACLGLASHYVAGTDLHEYRARIADQRGDIHCSNRELEKAEVNYQLAQETADASGQLWLKAHVGNSIARLRLLQGRPAEARHILESFEPVWIGNTGAWSVKRNQELRKISLPSRPGGGRLGKLRRCRANLSQRARQSQKVWLEQHGSSDPGPSSPTAHETWTQGGGLCRVGPGFKPRRPRYSAGPTVAVGPR